MRKQNKGLKTHNVSSKVRRYYDAKEM